MVRRQCGGGGRVEDDGSGDSAEGSTALPAAPAHPLDWPRVLSMRKLVAR